MNILDAMRDDSLFARHFRRNWRGADTWKAWRAFLAALFALPMDEPSLALYRQHTQRSDAPAEPFSEAWAICGRRSGKSLIAALVGVFLSAFRDYSDYRAPGEVLLLPIIAPDRRQCRTILGYIGGFFDSSPALASMVKARLKESIELTNGVRIEVHTANFRTVRGYSACGCVLDEAAFLRSEDSASPDSELIAAITPMMSTIPGALLLAISSPYARKGELWKSYREHFGKNDSPVLVWQAETRAMNPSVSRAVIAAAYLRDHAAASAEYGAQFRSDVESFLSIDVVERCVIPGRRELPPMSGTTYFGFTDPSGGQSDSFTLGIAHSERGKSVVDVLCERTAPFSPEQVVAEFSEVLKRYRVWRVTGDAFAGQWPREQFSKRGIDYRTAELTRSELYLELLPALTSGQVELPDNDRLKMQLVSLERRTGRSGRDSVDHAPGGGHDDLANAAAGAVVEVLRSAGGELGLVNYLKGLADGTIPDPFANKPAAIAAPSPCPDCHATCVTLLFGNVYRCAQCGKQFTVREDSQTAVLPNRKNLEEFSGARPRMNPAGFNRTRAFLDSFSRRS